MHILKLIVIIRMPGQAFTTGDIEDIHMAHLGKWPYTKSKQWIQKM